MVDHKMNCEKLENEVGALRTLYPVSPSSCTTDIDDIYKKLKNTIQIRNTKY